MALWICADCSAAYAVGLSACPQCESTDYYEEGTMPKITVHGGPSNAYEWVGEHGPELLDLPTGQSITPTDQPGPEEEPSPGTSSETSSPKPRPSPETSAPDPGKPAQTTGNPSAKAPTGSSTAPGTAGAPTAPTSATADEA